jgi:predicted unusual protein kinase regulating ubiquinone biosynthesis (AarF/ABC1/UbiB family)
MSASMFDLMWGKSMEELRNLNPEDMIRFADRFRDIMYSMPFQLPQNLLFLGRTVAILSGMCTGLDSEFNLWDQLSPYAAKLVSQEAGSNWRFWLDELVNVLKELATLPTKASRVLTQLERGEVIVEVPSVNRQIIYLERAMNRLTGSLVFTGLLIASATLYNAGNTLLAAILLGGAGITLIWIIFSGRGSPRRFHP